MYCKEVNNLHEETLKRKLSTENGKPCVSKEPFQELPRNIICNSVRLKFEVPQCSMNDRQKFN